jgi:hypothetical protein
MATKSWVLDLSFDITRAPSDIYREVMNRSRHLMYEYIVQEFGGRDNAPNQIMTVWALDAPFKNPFLGAREWINKGQTLVKDALPIEMENYVMYYATRVGTMKFSRLAADINSSLRLRWAREPTIGQKLFGTEEEMALERGRKAFKDAVCSAPRTGQASFKSFAGSRLLGYLRSTTKAQDDEVKHMTDILAPICTGDPGNATAPYNPKKPFGAYLAPAAAGLPAYKEARKAQINDAHAIIDYVLKKDFEAQADYLNKLGTAAAVPKPVPVQFYFDLSRRTDAEIITIADSFIQNNTEDVVTVGRLEIRAGAAVRRHSRGGPRSRVSRRRSPRRRSHRRSSRKPSPRPSRPSLTRRRGQ